MSSVARAPSAFFQRRTSCTRPKPCVKCFAKAKEHSPSATGIAFQPFEEVEPVLATTSKIESTKDSFARSDYHQRAESGINEQINVEYSLSYVYHSMYAFFDRDSVGLPGFAHFFKEASDEEREHAEKLMEYQNTRGGRVKLQAIMMPEVELINEDKGEALFAMELALALEKLNFQKLRHLRGVADEVNDPALADFVDSELLRDQAESVKKHAEYVSQLRRIGKGHAVWHFDRELSEAA